MAFNNATKLVVSEHEFDGDIFKRVELIEKIMPEMFKIACSMPTLETDNDDVPH
jgi:3-dehydroquinate dehydratase